MTAWHRRAWNALIWAVSASGVAYGWMKYMLAPSDPFAVVNHPWQGAMLDIHVLTAPALLVVFGIVLNAHAGPRLAQCRRRVWSGLLTLTSVGVMAASGYFLQVATEDATRSLATWIHVGSGALFAAAYLRHLVAS